MRTLKIALLGCTGSIGSTTLKVLRNHKDKYKLVLIANNENLSGLKKIADEFRPEMIFCKTRQLLIIDNKEVPFDNDFLSRAETYSGIDIVVNGIVGLAGLAPTFAVMYAGKILATANKESLVCAGNLINAVKEKYNCEIRPVDSEHSTLWQCMGTNKNNIEALVLTASGGAFRDYSKEQLETATALAALKHPNWVMGKKVTIDCATLVNKGMEVIEAVNLFRINDIKVVIHRESIIHSLVEMKDGTLIAGLSNPDMEIPIQYALTYPERLSTKIPKLSLSKIGCLHFEEIDTSRFPCFELCRLVAQKGDYWGIVLNAADEVAVDKYLKGEIGFYGINRCIEKALQKFDDDCKINTVEEVYRIDHEVREYILKSF